MTLAQRFLQPIVVALMLSGAVSAEDVVLASEFHPAVRLMETATKTVGGKCQPMLKQANGVSAAQACVETVMEQLTSQIPSMLQAQALTDKDRVALKNESEHLEQAIQQFRQFIATPWPASMDDKAIAAHETCQLIKTADTAIDRCLEEKVADTAKACAFGAIKRLASKISISGEPPSAYSNRFYALCGMDSVERKMFTVKAR